MARQLKGPTPSAPPARWLSAQLDVRLFILLITILLAVLHPPKLYSYSVLTHEAIIDSLWTDALEPLLRQKFPGLTAQDLKTAHAYAYGG